MQYHIIDGKYTLGWWKAAAAAILAAGAGLLALHGKEVAGTSCTNNHNNHKTSVVLLNVGRRHRVRLTPYILANKV